MGGQDISYLFPTALRDFDWKAMSIYPVFLVLKSYNIIMCLLLERLLTCQNCYPHSWTPNSAYPQRPVFFNHFLVYILKSHTSKCPHSHLVGVPFSIQKNPLMYNIHHLPSSQVLVLLHSIMLQDSLQTYSLPFPDWAYLAGTFGTQS